MAGASERNGIPASTGGDARPRKKRRWLRRVAVVLVLLIALVAAAPYIVATGPVLRAILSLVNDRIHGRVEIDELSLGWFTPAEARGVRVHDRLGRRVLEVERVVVSGGLARRVLSGQSFGRIEVDSPAVAIHRTPDGGISLVEAFSSRRPDRRDEPEDGELPRPVGRIVVRNASVVIAQPDGRTLELTGIGTEIDVRTLDAVSGTAVVAFAKGGKLSLEFGVSEFVRAGELRPEKATLSASVKTPEPIALLPLSEFALEGTRLAGTAVVDANVSLAGGSLRGALALDAVGLSAARGGRDDVTPTDVRLRGRFTRLAKRIEGTWGVSGPCGRLDGAFHYTAAGKPASLSAEDVLAAVLTGRKLDVPDCSLDANGQIDLPKLARAIPALLRVRKDAAIVKGTFRLDRLAFRGGAHPGARGDVAIAGLVTRAADPNATGPARPGEARDADANTVWPKVEAKFDLAVLPGTGLRIRDTRVAAPSVRLDANGTSPSLQANFTADLAGLREQLGRVIELGDLKLAGRVTGRLTTTVADEQEAEFDLHAEADALAYDDGPRKLDLASASFAATGVLLRPRADAAVVTSTYRLDANDELVVSGGGRFDAARRAWEAEAIIERGVVAGLVRMAGGLGAGGAEGLAGMLGGWARAKREAAEEPLVSSGDLTLGDLTLHAKPVGEPTIRLAWSGVRMGADGREWAVDDANLTGAPLSVHVRGLRVRRGEKLAAEGKVEISADLAACADVAGRLRGETEPLALAGRLTWSGEARPDANGVLFSGGGGVDDLVVGRGKQAERLGAVTLAHAAQLDAGGQILRVRKLAVTSRLGTVESQGVVTVRLGPRPAADGTVTVSADLAKCAALAARLSGEKEPAPVAGLLAWPITLRTEGEAIAVSGKGDIQRLVIGKGERARRVEPVMLALLARLEPADSVLRIQDLHVVSKPLTVTVPKATGGLTVRYGPAPGVDGQLSVAADLAVCAELEALLRGEQKPTPVSGVLTWAGRARSEGREIVLAGSGQVAGFTAGAGAQAARVEPLTFRQAVRIDPNAQSLRIDDLQLASDALTVTATGTVRQLDTLRVLDISGHYKGDWEKLLAVAHQVAPETQDLALTGPAESDFRLTGPASQPKLRPVFRDMGAQAGVGWTTARYHGFSLGKAALPVKLAGGQVVVPVTEVAGGGGTIRLGGTVDLRQETAHLRLPGRTAVLDGVEINKEVAHEFLSRFNPIFAELVSAEGRISLTTQDLDLPLGPAIKTAGSGGGQLDLRGMKVRPGGLMAALMALGGLREDQAHVLEVSSVDFQVHDGAIHYRNFTMVFDKVFDLTFHGSVRFDDGLDLVASVPVRSALLRRFGVRGRVDEYARLLEGTRVDVPVLGTRLKPKLDLARVDIQSLVKKAMEQLLKKEAGGLLDKILQSRKDGGATPGEPDRPRPEGPRTRPAPKKPRDEAAETIFDLLDGLLKPKKKADR